jgi:hypothetical protein
LSTAPVTISLRLTYTNLALLKAYKFLPEQCASKEFECLFEGELGTALLSEDVALSATAIRSVATIGEPKQLSMMVVAAQDIGPFPPNQLVSYLFDGDRILAHMLPMELPEIKTCSAQWAADSQLASKQEEDKRFEQEEVNFERYLRCYSKAFNVTPTLRKKFERAAANEQKTMLQTWQRWRSHSAK